MGKVRTNSAMLSELVPFHRPDTVLCMIPSLSQKGNLYLELCKQNRDDIGVILTPQECEDLAAALLMQAENLRAMKK